MKPRFFATPAAFRRWLAAHHDTETELYVGFVKVGAGKRSITYHEALDEALAFGWIDGVRKGLDAERYTIRFTPRKRGSYWSAVNTARAKALIAAGRMADSGLRAFNARDAALTAKYSHERAAAALDAASLQRFKAHPEAWAFFSAQPPGYRKVAAFFVMGAKREETRARRLDRLIADSANHRRIGLLERPSK